MKKRTRTLFAIFTLFLAVAGAAAVFRNLPPTIPSFDEAHFVHIGIRGLRILEIKQEDFGHLRQILEATNKDRSPKKWAVSGTLELKKKGTSVSNIQIFTNPNGPGPLEISDTYYLGYDQESFQDILDRSKPADLP